VNLCCGIPFGLMLRSNAESLKDGPERNLFGVDTVIGFIASLGVKVMTGVLLGIVPSAVILFLLGLPPRTTDDERFWILSLMVAMAIGKGIRWYRWSRRQDFR
jgi:hypothetical protein